MTGTSDLHQLSQDKTRGSSTNQQDLGTEWHLELVHSVDSARSGLEKGGLLVGEVLDLVALGKVATPQHKLERRGQSDLLLHVVGETTVSGNTSGGEVFTEEFLSSSTVVTV